MAPEVSCNFAPRRSQYRRFPKQDAKFVRKPYNLSVFCNKFRRFQIFLISKNYGLNPGTVEMLCTFDKALMKISDLNL